MASEDNQFFKSGDSVLCYRKKLLFEAVCIKTIKLNDGGVKYFVHYKGLANKWNEWVDNDRVLVKNDYNMNKMAFLKKFYSKKDKTKKKRINTKSRNFKRKKENCLEVSSKSDQTISVSSSSEPKQQKRDNETAVITMAMSAMAMPAIAMPAMAMPAMADVPVHRVKIVPIIVINIPTLLKERILFDNVMVTQHNKIPKLSETYTTAKVIQAFICESTRLGFHQRERSYNIGLTLIQYFNELIHKCLLYREERTNGIQIKAKLFLYEKIYKKNIFFDFHKKLSPKNLWYLAYGPIYLLRLFDKIIPNILNQCNDLNESMLKYTVENFETFLKYLESNYDKYFPENDYEEINNIK